MTFVLFVSPSLVHHPRERHINQNPEGCQCHTKVFPQVVFTYSQMSLHSNVLTSVLSSAPYQVHHLRERVWFSYQVGPSWPPVPPPNFSPKLLLHSAACPVNTSAGKPLNLYQKFLGNLDIALFSLWKSIASKLSWAKQLFSGNISYQTYVTLCV